MIINKDHDEGTDIKGMGVSDTVLVWYMFIMCSNPLGNCCSHYDDVIMGATASQITSLSIVYSTVYSDADKKTPKLRVTGLCEGNSPGTGEFPAQMASNAENVSIWWRHHEVLVSYVSVVLTIAVTADDLAPSGAGPSAETTLTTQIDMLRLSSLWPLIISDSNLLIWWQTLSRYFGRN